jgi:hypothetical protein
MWFIAVTCSPRISGVAAMAGSTQISQKRRKTQQGAQAAAFRPNTGVWPAEGSGWPPEAGVPLKMVTKSQFELHIKSL